MRRNRRRYNKRVRLEAVRYVQYTSGTSFTQARQEERRRVRWITAFEALWAGRSYRAVGRRFILGGEQ